MNKYLLQAIKALTLKWNIKALHVIKHSAANCVVAGFQYNKPVILKLSLDNKSLLQEITALKAFKGRRALKVLTYDPIGAALLERAMPGLSLAAAWKEEESIVIASNLIKDLHQAYVPLHGQFPLLKDWCSVLNDSWNIPYKYLEKARNYAKELFKTVGKNKLLHGDLHHHNILLNSREWVAIDPKGVIGEESYEVAAFILNPVKQLLSHPNIESIILYRVKKFAQLLSLDENRIKKWCFIQTVMAWTWCLEDNTDPKWWANLTAVCDKIF